MTLKQVQERHTVTDTIVSNLQAQIQHRLPSQPFQNPKQNVSAMTLRSGKELKEPRKNKVVDYGIEVNKLEPNQDQGTTSNVKEVGKDKKEPYKPLSSFPSRLRGKTSR